MPQFLIHAGEIAQISMEITNEKQHFIWDGYGLQLLIPKNSLPVGVGKCVLHLTVNFSCPYEIPSDHKLVSAVYSINCKPEVEFMQELTLQIQHCANSDKLRFVRAADPSKSVDVLMNGVFSDSHSGSIQLKKFSWYMIVQLVEQYLGFSSAPDLIDYSVLPFYKVNSTNEVIIKIAICENLHALISVSLTDDYIIFV